MTKPKTKVQGAIKAMTMAMKKASISSSDIRWFNAHSTSNIIGECS